MREALNVIAEVTDSERLRQFLATGLDRKYHILLQYLVLLANLELDKLVIQIQLIVQKCREVSISLGILVI